MENSEENKQTDKDNDTREPLNFDLTTDEDMRGTDIAKTNVVINLEKCSAPIEDDSKKLNPKGDP